MVIANTYSDNVWLSENEINNKIMDIFIFVGSQEILEV